MSRRLCWFVPFMSLYYSLSQPHHVSRPCFLMRYQHIFIPGVAVPWKWGQLCFSCHALSPRIALRAFRGAGVTRDTEENRVDPILKPRQGQKKENRGEWI